MPSAKPNHARLMLSTRFLVFGLVGTALLAVPTVGLPLLELTRAQHTTLEIADDSQETTYDLGQVSAQLARLRFHALLPGSEGDVAHIERLLQPAIDALPGDLDPLARQRWASVEREVERLRQVYANAITATRAGQQARAVEILERERAAATSVHDSLSDLAREHRDSVLARLRVAHREAAWIRNFEIVLAAVFLAGLITIWSGVLRAVRRQRQQIVEYTARLESANEDLDAFAGRVAHDLKNALGPIVMAPSMLRREPGDTAAVLRIADRTERCSRRAVAVMDALLAFSRASRTAQADEASALRPAMKSVADELAPLISQLDVSLELEELPDAWVRCSPGLLHIVLANLCGNAVKYLEGQPERRVRVSAQIEGSACRIQVDDTGPGIPKEEQEKIFQPLYRVPGSRGPGTGIGLATVRRIVDARGGRVEVESEPGHGASFRVWLPLAPPREDSREDGREDGREERPPASA